jgi:hypothetical protein
MRGLMASPLPAGDDAVTDRRGSYAGNAEYGLTPPESGDKLVPLF